MCVNYKLCVKLHKGPFAFYMEKYSSLQNFYTHAVTDVTDNYQVWFRSAMMKVFGQISGLSFVSGKVKGQILCQGGCHGVCQKSPLLLNQISLVNKLKLKSN